MPHLIIETSRNIELKQPTALLSTLNQALFDTGHFTPATAIKARWHKADAECIGLEPHSHQAFIAVTLYLVKGRSEALKSQFCQLIADNIAQHLMQVESHIHLTGQLQITVNAIELADSYVKRIV
ncbi:MULTISPECIES: 5-carboxymethyl-2-hydroxymuconate Delta-isomerase [unclassified Moraxella]|uniref:5-carboxymethyl-2-hydroxymuconate Delta-isomerase n=1 Tax=unclassified Moraxella TaxID=2685852 RepID=UPI003AF7EFF4